MAQKDADLQRIEELLEVMKNNDLVEVEIKHGDDKILLKRAQPQQQNVTAVPVIGPTISSAPVISGNMQPAVSQSAASTEQQDSGLIEIKSPMVGTFYATPSPDSESFVEIGSRVDTQTIVCIVEAMKVMNEIKAETDGTIAEILVDSGQSVEYGQVLFKVKPD